VSWSNCATQFAAGRPTAIGCGWKRRASGLGSGRPRGRSDDRQSGKDPVSSPNHRERRICQNDPLPVFFARTIVSGESAKTTPFPFSSPRLQVRGFRFPRKLSELGVFTEWSSRTARLLWIQGLTAFVLSFRRVVLPLFCWTRTNE